jgi:flagellar basal-body rod protein FlgC
MRIGPAMAAAVSGLVAEGKRLAVSANNVANVSTPGFRFGTATNVDLPGGGVLTAIDPGGVPAAARAVRASEEADRDAVLSEVDLGAEVVAQVSARRGFEANLATLRATDEATRALLDTKR